MPPEMYTHITHTCTHTHKHIYIHTYTHIHTHPHTHTHTYHTNAGAISTLLNPPTWYTVRMRCNIRYRQFLDVTKGGNVCDTQTTLATPTTISFHENR
jgi:hypothetical protein